MRDSLFTRVLLGPLVLLPALTGCHLGHTVPTIPIVVLDAETKMPVPGAEVRLWSPSDNRKTSTEPSGTTGPDGIARIQAEYPKEADVLVEVAAQGYLQDELDRILAGKVPGAPAGGGIIEIYKGPRPVLELVIPTDLRGDLKVELRIQDATPDQLGKRIFRYTAPSGRFGSLEMPVAHVFGPPILEGRLGPEFRGIYASTGKPMPAEPKDSDIVLRWVKSEGLDHFFVIGTKIDQESARRASEKNIGPREMNNKSKGGDGGGGRRGGGGVGTGTPGMGGSAGGRPGFGANGVGGSGGY